MITETERFFLSSSTSPVSVEDAGSSHIRDDVVQELHLSSNKGVICLKTKSPALCHSDHHKVDLKSKKENALWLIITSVKKYRHKHSSTYNSKRLYPTFFDLIQHHRYVIFWCFSFSATKQIAFASPIAGSKQQMSSSGIFRIFAHYFTMFRICVICTKFRRISTCLKITALFFYLLIQ